MIASEKKLVSYAAIGLGVSLVITIAIIFSLKMSGIRVTFDTSTNQTVPCTPTAPAERPAAATRKFVFTEPDIAARRMQAEQDTRKLCGPGYPGPGGKDDCELAKKILVNPNYIKM